MKPSHGQRSSLNRSTEEKQLSAARQFIEANTHHNISMKREYVYIEDVKDAININTLEERLILKRWLIKQLQKGQAEEATSGAVSKPYEALIRLLSDSEEKDRHRLQKDFKIRV